MLLEVLHGHGGEVEELVSHFVRPLKARSLTDVPQDALNLVKDLKQPTIICSSILRFLDTFARVCNCKCTYVTLTSPAKKQTCFLSICFPKVICNSVSLMWRVSTMSHSRARGWFLRSEIEKKRDKFSLAASVPAFQDVIGQFLRLKMVSLRDLIKIGLCCNINFYAPFRFLGNTNWSYK